MELCPQMANIYDYDSVNTALAIGTVASSPRRLFWCRKCQRQSGRAMSAQLSWFLTDPFDWNVLLLCVARTRQIESTVLTLATADR